MRAVRPDRTIRENRILHLRQSRLSTTSTSEPKTDSSKILRGQVYPDLQGVRAAAIAKVHDMITEGDQAGENRRHWRIEIMDRANQPVLTMIVSETRDPRPRG